MMTTSKYIKSIATGKIYKLLGDSPDGKHYEAVDVDNDNRYHEDGTLNWDMVEYKFPKRLFKVCLDKDGIKELQDGKRRV